MFGTFCFGIAIVITSIIVLIAIAYFIFGVPGDEIVQIVSAGLLAAAIIYVIAYPLIDMLREVRSTRDIKRIIKLKNSNEEIDTMSWQDFEIYVAQWLKDEGYRKVCLTEHYDLGIDIIAEKDGQKWGVQVKHYTNMVKINAVRQVIPALKHYKCDRAMVVTNSFFSQPAKSEG